MNNRHNIPAFTIIEAIVSMAITAIILSIIFVIFSFTSQRLMDFKKENEHINELNRLSYSINKSIFESEKMQGADEEILFDTYNGDIIRYSISEEYFVRSQGEFTDTFHLTSKNIHFEVLDNSLKNIAYQRLQWNLEVDGKTMKLNFYKKLYATELIKPIDK
ncbi:prepilin-type N-terminal cleavage/methylation domain-containing protein [Flavobacterium sp. NRK1]|uniref:prepilin-type N-terminal cleavage/methylation domain-containing protein n=1 Tax=Flavobacterium sp. NRK1 TaxID=2954929 RepID=UPI0020930EF2|nr:prepilin-type N-terminal cleavage/methylation domain-containing protein [Flavobacterium sp. NRK1]MCO6147921.1 prepilin-type N-terminal cleavage/methylation domain-containing protein [Flavobacterium sp. NRK1]